MNRILQYLDCCPCCRAERLSEKWKAVAEQLGSVIGDDLVEMIYPGPSSFLDAEKGIEIAFWYRDVMSLKPICSLLEASEQTIGELRRVSGLLSAAADRLDFGKGVLS